MVLFKQVGFERYGDKKLSIKSFDFQPSKIEIDDVVPEFAMDFSQCQRQPETNYILNG